MSDNHSKLWLKSYPEGSSCSIDYPNIPLYELLDNCTKNYPKNTATIYFGSKLTYEKLQDQVNQFAGALWNLGVRKGSKVAIMLPNCPQYVISYFAILKLGAAVVQTSPLYVEKELKFQLNDSGAEVIITLDLLHNRIVNVIEETPLENVIFTSISDYMSFPIKQLYKLKQWKEGTKVKIEPRENFHNFRSLLSGSYILDYQVDIEPETDVAVIQYTGGTTGRAKGVMLTHRNLVANALQVKEWAPSLVEGKDDVLGAVPFFHVYGMTVAMNLNFTIAGSLILVPKFEVEEILKLINKYKPAVFPGAPTMYIGIVNHPEINKYDLTSIKVCISGSAPLPIEVQQKFEAITRGNLVEGYGLSEASPVTHCTPIYGKRKPGIGLPFPDTDCKIIDESGQELGPGEIGELIVKGPQVMKGYLNRVEETEEVLSSDGWLKTGDIAIMDDEGYFSIVDRKKDVIIAGGFNIYPRDVEEVLFEHPKIKEAVVLGIPHEYRGETVKAFVVLNDNETATAEEIQSFCKQRMAKFKVPTEIEFRDDLPKNMVGKVLRRVLQEEVKKTS
ncbi:long-chain acyl-CoA synthetase [Desulfitispora alkaliphila]|uniref:long-chain-fatty-acid--CoA ligase n=1 Tax=Desulfitispora alkaliphila TaxID=622674 RepID=UPI003D1CBA5B